MFSHLKTYIWESLHILNKRCFALYIAKEETWWWITLEFCQNSWKGHGRFVLYNATLWYLIILKMLFVNNICKVYQGKYIKQNCTLSTIWYYLYYKWFTHSLSILFLNVIRTGLIPFWMSSKKTHMFIFMLHTRAGDLNRIATAFF